ncbi:hypothetical protein OCU04_008478 [Sclerotinia nivalis]|uniref:Mitochondrial division protein 1 n=1 Tax=Sclerotinia nivalis TaxID=352851 RepID=A0A9X0AI50_9HELO|nr:hypothetical protein OCU04_008478 [Sclerotinia nivalis]
MANANTSGMKGYKRQRFREIFLCHSASRSSSTGGTVSTQSPVNPPVHPASRVSSIDPTSQLSSVGGTVAALQSSPIYPVSHLLSSKSTISIDDFLDKVLEKLEDRDRNTIKQFTPTKTNDINSTFCIVYKLTQEEQKNYKDKKWKITLRDKDYVIRNITDKVLSGLEKFNRIGDLIANVDPIHVGLPWAGISFLLQGTLAGSRQMDILFMGLNIALDMINRLKVYMDYMRDLPSATQQNEFTNAQTNFENAMMSLYVIVLEFLAKAIQIYTKPSLNRNLEALLPDEKLLNFEVQCNSIAKKVEDAAVGCDRILTRDHRQNTTQKLDDIHKVLKELDKLQNIENFISALSEKTALDRLPFARDAAFDSHRDEHDARCLENTRVELQRQISKWAEDPNGKSIFWLNGMAGTGKSTISRTVAQSFEEKNLLGASFFFKRGEGDRGTASKFFTTIAHQLVVKKPQMVQSVKKAIDLDPNIYDKSLAKQFEQLISKPLSELDASPQRSTLVLVIDALDECEREKDVKEILRLLALIRNIAPIHLRIFVTSRPDLPIRLGFHEMLDAAHQDFVLHEIPKATIEHDITIYLKYEFEKIKANNDRGLAQDWPGEESIQDLVRMASPLFIFAATACRFIADPNWNPKKRLEIILEYRMAKNMSKFDKTYLPILNQLFINQDEEEKKMLAREFRQIIGVIIILADPLSIVSLASLLNVPKEDIKSRLVSLHSVLDIPMNEDAPVRLYHLSFHDFLLGLEERNLLRIDEKEAHKEIARNCRQLLSRPGCLKENLCNLGEPGTLQTQVDEHVINENLPPHVQYACRYWDFHIQKSNDVLLDNCQVHKFLQKHFLHWVETMSLIGRISECITAINSLESCISVSQNSFKKLLLINAKVEKAPELFAFTHDAKRFVLHNRIGIEQAPLQIYYSALFFAPENSIIRKTFQKCIPSWIYKISRIRSNWSAAPQTLEGHSNSVKSVAFSPDGTKVASGSGDGTIRLWDTTTNESLQTLKGHSDWINSVAFSSDGTKIASGSDDRTIRLWDMTTGKLFQTFEGHSNSVNSVAFSPDNTKVASSSWDRTIRFWDTITGESLQTFEGHSNSVKSIAFSLDGTKVASGSGDRTIRLWDTITNELLQTLEGHSDWVNSVAFSPDSIKIVSGSDDRTIRLWDTTTGELLQILEGHSNSINSVAFSPNGTKIASGSDDRTIRLWDTTTGELFQTLKGHSDSVSSVAFSSDNTKVASGSRDRTIRLWDTTTGELLQTLKGHSDWVNSVAFSPDGTKIASSSKDRTIWLWDTTTGELLQMLEGHSDWISSVAFSSDGTKVASGSGDRTIRLLDTTTNESLQTLEGHSHWVSSVAFSLDGTKIASGSWDRTIRLWDTTTGELLQMFEGHSDSVSSVAFSPDGTKVASGSSDRTIRLWDTTTGESLQTLEGHPGSEASSAFKQYFISNHWIAERSDKEVRNIFWLPSDYRPTSTCFCNGIMVMGFSTGSIFFLKFE